MQREIIYRQKEGISSRKLGNDLMLYDQENDKVHILNETGAMVWELLSGKNKILDIENTFIKQFANTLPEELKRDINEILEKLVSEGLIELCY